MGINGHYLSMWLIGYMTADVINMAVICCITSIMTSGFEIVLAMNLAIAAIFRSKILL